MRPRRRVTPIFKTLKRAAWKFAYLLPVWSTPERLRGEVLTTWRYTNLRIKQPTNLGSVFPEFRCRRSCWSGRCIWTARRMDVSRLRCLKSPSLSVWPRHASQLERRSASPPRSPYTSPAPHTAIITIILQNKAILRKTYMVFNVRQSYCAR